MCANSKACDLFGMPALVNTNLLKLLPDGNLRELLKKACEAREMVRTTVHVPRTDGERIYRAKATPLATRERHIGIVCLDVTEEHRTQVIRRDFVANASHELRTPLTLILGYLETLLDDPESAEDRDMRQRSLSIMKRHADRMARLVADMLMLSRVETPNTSYLKQEEFDFRQLTGDVLQRLESAIAAQKAEVELDVEPLQLMGDSFYWSQVLFNLLENALDACRMLSTGGKKITVRGKYSMGAVYFEVSNPFSGALRKDNAGEYLSTKVHGQGLGLQSVSHIVQIQGGTMELNTDDGIFRVSLLLPEDKEPSQN